ncbi:hypothetical protein GVAV_000192 [Gurleya vavrai]
MIKLQNKVENPIKIEKTIFIKREIPNLDVYIQTYGIVKDNYIQAATDIKLISLLKELLELGDLKSVLIDSLETIVENKTLNYLINFLNINGVRVYLKKL